MADQNGSSKIPKKERTLRELLMGLAEDSSLHGVPKIVSSRQIPIKILWCLLFLTTFVVLMIQIYNLFVTFNAYPIQTSVSLEFSPLSFPAITICNMNPVRRSEIDLSQNVKDIIYPKVKKTSSSSSGARKKRETVHKLEGIPFEQYPQSRKSRPATQTRKRVRESEIDYATDDLFEYYDLDFQRDELYERVKRDVSSQPVNVSESMNSISATAVVSSGNVSPPVSSTVDLESSASSSTIPSVSATAASGSSGLGSAVPSSSYYYEYDYWGYFDYSTSSYDSNYEEWAEWYSSYYSSLYGYGSSRTGDYDYGGDYSSGSGYENFLYDQYFSPKDRWDERIVKFQTVFKNESKPLRSRMGHRREDVIVGATFVRTVQNITNFEEFTTPEYGNCFTMTSPKYKAWRSGPAHGIKLTLNLEVNEYIQNFATGYGIRIVFHAPGTYPLASEEGLTLSPGYETSVGLRMVQISRLGKPYGECSDGKAFQNQYGIRYSPAACMQFCRVQKAIEMCDCIPHDAPDLDFKPGVRVCSNVGPDKICTIQVDVKFDDGSYSSECDCMSPCHEIIYEKTLSGRRWPNDDYLTNVLLSNACSQNISSLTDACARLQNNTFGFEESEKYRNNFLRVLIYYEDLNYESITQEPLYESVRFLSDIGGAMGLFMGASLLSFVEFLQLGLELFLFCWKKMMNYQQVGSIPPHQDLPYESKEKGRLQTPLSLVNDPSLIMDK